MEVLCRTIVTIDLSAERVAVRGGEGKGASASGARHTLGNST